MQNYLKISLIFLSLMVFSCTQEPAEIVVHSTTSPVKASFASNNPYKTIVEKGDTLYSIARKNNVEIRAMIDANRLRPPYILIPGQTVKLPKAAFHIVSENDNLYAISRSYGVDISRLAQKNNLSSPYNLTPGQKLLLPSPTENDAPASITAKTEKYDFGTAAKSTSSSTVTSAELAPIGSTKPEVKKTISSTSGNDEDSPFASPRDNGQHKDVVTKNNDIKEAAKDEDESPFTHQSNNETTASKKPVPIAPVNKISPVKSAPIETTPSENVSTKLDIPSPDSKSTPDKKPTSKSPVIPQPKAASAGEDSPFVAPETTTKTAGQATTKSGSVKTGFNWPLTGNIISKFGPKKGGLYNDGINIEAKEGTPIKAAEDGEVVYAGNELRGYGNMLLIKHSNGYLTAYAHTDDFLVKKGDVIKKGQLIAHVGQTGHVSSPQLHFSIRQGRKAIDPEKYLPPDFNM